MLSESCVSYPIWASFGSPLTSYPLKSEFNWTNELWLTTFCPADLLLVSSFDEASSESPVVSLASSSVPVVEP